MMSRCPISVNGRPAGGGRAGDQPDAKQGGEQDDKAAWPINHGNPCSRNGQAAASIKREKGRVNQRRNLCDRNCQKRSGVWIITGPSIMNPRSPAPRYAKVSPFFPASVWAFSEPRQASVQYIIPLGSHPRGNLQIVGDARIQRATISPPGDQQPPPPTSRFPGGSPGV